MAAQCARAMTTTVGLARFGQARGKPECKPENGTKWQNIPDLAGRFRICSIRNFFCLHAQDIFFFVVALLATISDGRSGIRATALAEERGDFGVKGVRRKGKESPRQLGYFGCGKAGMPNQSDGARAVAED